MWRLSFVVVVVVLFSSVSMCVSIHGCSGHREGAFQGKRGEKKREALCVCVCVCLL